MDEFLARLQERIERLDEQGIPTDRFMTVYAASLQSVKKIERADIVIGVDGAIGSGDPVLVERRSDPTKSHPYRQKRVLEEVGELHGRRFTGWSFTAVQLHLDLRSKAHLCYRDEEVALTRWSPEVVAVIRRLTLDEFEMARASYLAHLREARERRKAEKKSARSGSNRR